VVELDVSQEYFIASTQGVVHALEAIAKGANDNEKGGE